VIAVFETTQPKFVRVTLVVDPSSGPIIHAPVNVADGISMVYAVPFEIATVAEIVTVVDVFETTGYATPARVIKRPLKSFTVHVCVESVSTVSPFATEPVTDEVMVPDAFPVVGVEVVSVPVMAIEPSAVKVNPLNAVDPPAYVPAATLMVTA
jgi:hypothetical protein